MLVAVLAPSVLGQDRPAPPTSQVAADTAVVRVDLTDGSSFFGVVLREDAQTLVLRTTGGAEVTVPRDQIRRITEVEGRVVGDRFVTLDPNRTRLLFSPTARALGAGDGYIAVYELVLPFLAYGITDAVSIAGGTVFFPGAFGRVWYIAPKVTLLERPDLAVAIGGVGLGVFLDDDSATAGIGYGIVTYGTPERSVTGGFGFSFAEGELATGVIVTLGGELQVSNRMKLLSENYLVPYEEYSFTTAPETRTRYQPILSFGVRFFGERLAVDLAGFTLPGVLSDEAFPFFPWVGFAFNF